METSETLRYNLADTPLEQYEAELDQLWADLKDPNSDVSQDAKAHGINVELVRQLERKQAIDLRTEESAFDPTFVTLVVALAPLAIEIVKASAPIIKDLWIEVLRPRLVQAMGGHVLRPKEGSSDQ